MDGVTNSDWEMTGRYDIPFLYLVFGIQKMVSKRCPKNTMTGKFCCGKDFSCFFTIFFGLQCSMYFLLFWGSL